MIGGCYKMNIVDHVHDLGGALSLMNDTFGNGSMLLIFAILLLAVLFAGFVFFLNSMNKSERRQSKLMGHLREEHDNVLLLRRQMDETTRQIAEWSAAMDVRSERMNRSFDERMELLNQTNARQLNTITERLEGVHRGLGEMRELSDGVSELRRMLGNVKTRGIWGEVQLRSVLEEMFAPSQYIENAAIPAGGRTVVEYALKLPSGEGEVLLPIDSKFPLEDYLRLMEYEANDDREAAEKAAMKLERAVLEQAKKIGESYIKPPQTVNYAVLFLPIESLYAEAARRGDLILRTQEKYRVLIAGPTTLCALLTSLRVGMQSAEVERHSAEVLSMLDEFRTSFSKLDGSVARIRKYIEQTEQELDTLQSHGTKIKKWLNNAAK